MKIDSLQPKHELYKRFPPHPHVLEIKGLQHRQNEISHFDCRLDNYNDNELILFYSGLESLIKTVRDSYERRMKMELDQREYKEYLRLREKFDKIIAK